MVKITITERAIEQLRRVRGNKHVKLTYDTDDCGCAVNGVPMLLLVDQLDEHDVEIETNDIPIWMEKHRLIFFDEQMTIDVVDGAGCFQLKSPNQILNARMSLMER
ncbi:iron-sulfur cluster biosynthesis family protein [Anoxybacillus ayderensis]|uniref:iron-sulfur cluster biosynthesis family protein n=1 Tax=Anoxybacillus ayderensis TaxID=265546 RepID=UPI000A26BC47|nr:iron-sulfur cluster biosynthesis family protein [Anoxybacillus ayderensis]MED0687506.1 iron-sulfur cluster biosynthesis family protein [Anoxybacillus ayderensis]OSX54662.1 heme biosynthesis protein HemY [Anoxybacillus ayderensis]